MEDVHSSDGDQGRHRHGRHVHRSRRRRRRERALVPGEGALDPGRPGRGGGDGVRSRRGSTRATSTSVVVGTTIGINAVLTRSGARVVYLTTKGFEDIPYIQRITASTTTTSTGGSRHHSFVGATASASPSGSTRRAASSSPLDRDALAATLDAADARRRRCSRRGLPPLLLPEPGARAARPRASTPACPGCPSRSRTRSRRSGASTSAATTVIVDAYLKPLFDDYVDGSPQALAGAGIGAALVAAEVERRRERSRQRRARGRRTCCCPASPAAPSAARYVARAARGGRRSRSTWAAPAATSA